MQVYLVERKNSRTFVRANNSMATECLVVRRLCLNRKSYEESNENDMLGMYVDDVGSRQPVGRNQGN